MQQFQDVDLGECLYCVAHRYVRGDFRFKSYCKSNPRKMVKVWAEKEFRNLSRLRAAGIRSPEPVQLRMHVLAMEFVGTGGVAAPRLKVGTELLQLEGTDAWLPKRGEKCHVWPCFASRVKSDSCDL